MALSWCRPSAHEAAFEGAGDPAHEAILLLTELKASASILEPESAHEASVILLHGLGCGAGYWKPIYECLAQSGARIEGVRWLALQAPERQVWDEPMTAWFEYLTCHCGEDKEDEINQAHVAELRAALHGLIEHEAECLRELGGAQRVLLMGTSQGGSAALDAGLTLPGPVPVAGVVMLRSLALGVTAASLSAWSSASSAAAPAAHVPVLAVSGGADETFALSLVQRQLERLKGSVTVTHSVLDGLDHDTDYDSREVALAIAFIAERLELGLSGPVDPDAIDELLPKPASCDKSWDCLTEAELRLASQLGIRSAKGWDDGIAAVWSKDWRELSYLQRKAAATLGFDADLWNQTDERSAAGASARDKSWAQLTEAERKLAGQLGVHGANAWDSSTAPVWSRAWAKLSHAQHKAAAKLGFDEATWNEDDK